MRRAAIIPISLVLAAACSAGGGGDDAATPSPSVAARQASDRLPTISSSSDPYLVDRNCEDFASAQDAQDFYIEAGGPDQDLHGLDPDRNGDACDEQTPSPIATARVTETARPASARPPIATAEPPAAPPKEFHSSSGAVDGKTGGSDSSSSCESSDEARCR